MAIMAIHSQPGHRHYSVMDLHAAALRTAPISPVIDEDICEQ